MEQLLQVAEGYCSSLNSEYFKTKFTKALLDSFLGGTRNTYSQWDFLDLGMVYRGKRPGGSDFTFHKLCPPAQKALLRVFKSMSLLEDIRSCLNVGANLTGDQFEQALFLLFVSADFASSSGRTSDRGLSLSSADLAHCGDAFGGLFSPFVIPMPPRPSCKVTVAMSGAPSSWSSKVPPAYLNPGKNKSSTLRDAIPPKRL